MILYMSVDNGALYNDVDNPIEFEWLDVNEDVRFTPAQLCGADGQIAELLLRTGQARLVTDRRNL